MSRRQIRILVNLHERYTEPLGANSVPRKILRNSIHLLSTVSICTDLPRKLKKDERKPWVTNINELKRRGRKERREKLIVREKILKPPENGLLVKSLIPVAHEVYASRSEVIACASMVAKHTAIYRCSICGEVHIGNPPHMIRTCNMRGSLPSKEHKWEKGSVEHILPLVDSFHLYDRLGMAVSHNERLEVDRIPAIIELCIQAGISIQEYPTRRRAFPAYCVSGRIIDFEKRFPKEEKSPGKDITAFGFWRRSEKSKENVCSLEMQPNDLQGIASRGMKAWEKMRSGTSKLIRKYAVQTCGYCPEVQVGPKGHRVRNCQAYKHQMRDGQHDWQEATVDDLIPPVYVWHVRDPTSEKPLTNYYKRYYGMLPGVVELFFQAGAGVSSEYSGIMRDDVAVPEKDEERLVV